MVLNCQAPVSTVILLTKICVLAVGGISKVIVGIMIIQINLRSLNIITLMSHHSRVRPAL